MPFALLVWYSALSLKAPSRPPRVVRPAFTSPSQ
jgi:hypothetical protein